MLLNETKPPLEEALAHYGVLGMRWGRRNSQSRSSLEDNYDEMLTQERHDQTKRRIAAGALVAAGTIASVVILHKTGTIKISPALIASGREAASKFRPRSPSEERARFAKPFVDARKAYIDSDFAKRTFRPETVGNPLWTRTGPAKPKFQFKDGPDFDWSPKSSARVMRDGVFKVHNMDPDIWDVPMLALTSGRKKR